MTAKITPTNRWDAIDREQFRTMIESDGFKAIQDRIVAERDRAIETCIRSGDTLELPRAQGAVAALQTAIELPRRLLAEMSVGVKR